MNRLYRAMLIGVLLLVTSQVFTPAAAAHPLGNFTINHYAGLSVGRDAITVDYVLDMAEIPAFQEILTFDANRNSRPDVGEYDRYPASRCDAIRTQLALRLDRRRIPLILRASAVEFPPGAGGLATLRLTCLFQAPIVMTRAPMHLLFQDNAYAERLGWRELVVTADDVTVHGDFTTTSISNRLTTYPSDQLQNPLDQRSVALVVVPSAGTSEQSSPQSVVSTKIGQSRSRDDTLTRLIAVESLNLSTLVVALVLSAVWGGMHALSPGHGKTIVGAYLVGARGTAQHAVFLGITTTLTHTVGVFALGAVTLLASRFIVAEQLYPWLSVLSGLLIVAIGLNLCLSRLRSARRRHVGHRHEMPHAHHDHDHTHIHHHADDHTGEAHAHHLPGADGSPLTWRSLLALGVSGGLLPCPSALVVMLSAIALDRIGFGLLLVLAFSLGLAGVLTGIGLLFVSAGRLFERLALHDRALQYVPVASALFIVLTGVGVTAQALVQTGWIRIL